MCASDGVDAFTQFLRTEFSEENIEFWLACEEYKAIDSETKLLSKAKCIYTVFIEADSPKEVRQHGRSTREWEEAGMCRFLTVVVTCVIAARVSR